jgi:hypothetical protein
MRARQAVNPAFLGGHFRVSRGLLDDGVHCLRLSRIGLVSVLRASGELLEDAEAHHRRSNGAVG